MNRKLSANIASKTGTLSRRLAKHFAALAIPAVLVPAAHAGIVWSGPVNINVPSNFDGVYLNVLNGATGTTSDSVSGWDINAYGSESLSLFSAGTPAGTHGVVRGLGSSTILADNLSFGTLIGDIAGLNFGNGRTETTGATAFLVNSSDNLVGFRFYNEGNSSIHYGWLRLSLAGTTGAQPRSIVGYAYEDVAGISIGAGVIPEPTAASLLVLGLGGLFGLRGWSRRQ